MSSSDNATKQRNSVIMEDEDENRQSSSYEMNSPQVTLNSIGDRISDLNLIDALP
jgi:hypothetical protein